MSSPSITVLMPVYNAEKYLREAIESILEQTFTDFEFLIINDGSTDKSEDIILSYTDTRIRYVKNESNLKLVATLNKGFNLATGKYVVRTDADDLNYPDRIELQYSFMEQNPSIGLSGTGFEIFGENTSVSKVQYSPDHNTICLKHLYQIHLSHGTSIFRMDVVKQHNLYFDPSYVHAEDYELWTRFSQVSRLANIQKVLYKVRHHEEEVSKLNQATQQQNSMRVKQNQFLKMGIKLSETEIHLFARVCQHEYINNKHFIETVQKLLECLMKANDKSSLIERNFFNKNLAQLWLNVTYNCTGLGLFSLKQFFSSPLCKYISLSTSQKISFYVKALARI